MRVLIVEDEPAIGMDLEEAVTEAGHEVIGWATGRASAIALGEARSPEFAFVDIQLRDGETGLEIARHLAQRGVTVVITTAQTDLVNDAAPALGVMPKPYPTETVEAVLNYAAKILEGAALEPETPVGFRRVGVHAPRRF